jgi:polyhydroxyalkanoate synthesis regulator phasin
VLSTGLIKLNGDIIMAPLSILMAGARLLKAGTRAAAVAALKKKHGLSESLANRVISKANELTKLSDKTGKPISELVKKGTGSQTVTKNVAKEGIKKGAIAGGAGGLGLASLVDAISETTKSNANTKSASSNRRKSPEGGQTIKENRRVVSETKLKKGGMAKKKYSKGGTATKFKPCAGCTSPKTCAKQGCKKKRS